MGPLVIAVDPGPVKSAYVMWDGQSILEKGIVGNDVLLHSLRTGWSDECVVVVEMIASYGMPVGRDVFNTCVWIGRFIQACRAPWHLVYRMDVKNHLCH